MNHNPSSRKSNFKYAISNKQIFTSSALLVFFVLFVTIATLSYRYIKTHPSQNKPVVESVKEDIVLDDWKEVKTTDKNVLVRYEKDSQAKIKPVLVLTSAKYTSTNQSLYVDRLINGAKSTLPSLRYTSDQDTSVDGQYSRTLVGYYQNSSTRVQIYQKLIITSDLIYTLTISYSDNEITSDQIDQIVSTLLSKYLK